MKRRTVRALIVTPLLAVAIACSPAVDPSGETQASDTPDGKAEATEQVAVEPSLQTSNVGIVGLSAMTTSGHVWAEPAYDSGNISIPLEVAMAGSHFHFAVQGASGPLEFIGYRVGNEFHIRATVCPACVESSVDYDTDSLICSACNARFDLQTGDAISGVTGYPTGSIPASVSDGAVRSVLHSLVVAYERTAAGEETLYKAPGIPFPIGCSGC